jgi:hypothetical protein
MYKKSVITAVCLIFVLIGAACSGITIPGSSSTSVSSNSSTSSTQLAVKDKLGIGILKLEGTALAITTEQASELLPLWKTLKSLSTSDTTSDAEIAALYQQIQETLSSDQVQAIQQLTWSAEDLQQYGIQGNSNGSAQSGTATKSIQTQSQVGGAGDPGGGMPGGDVISGMNPGVQGIQGTQVSQPVQGTAGSTQGLNLMLADSVIALLQNKA